MSAWRFPSIAASLLLAISLTNGDTAGAQVPAPARSWRPGNNSGAGAPTPKPSPKASAKPPSTGSAGPTQCGPITTGYGAIFGVVPSRPKYDDPTYGLSSVALFPSDTGHQYVAAVKVLVDEAQKEAQSNQVGAYSPAIGLAQRHMQDSFLDLQLKDKIWYAGIDGVANFKCLGLPRNIGTKWGKAAPLPYTMVGNVYFEGTLPNGQNGTITRYYCSKTAIEGLAGYGIVYERIWKWKFLGQVPDNVPGPDGNLPPSHGTIVNAAPPNVIPTCNPNARGGCIPQPTPLPGFDPEEMPKHCDDT